MCGIAGFIEAKAEKGPKELLAQVNAMTDAMLHRGPDSGGHWLSSEAGVGMAPMRLMGTEAAVCAASPTPR